MTVRITDQQLAAFADGEMSAEDMAALINDGAICQRSLAISVLGKVGAVAWWDMFGPLDPDVMGSAIQHSAASLSSGEYQDVARDHIPAPVWDRHRAKFIDPSRHGLTLADQPAACGVFRYDDGQFGMVIGYPLASQAT